MLAARYLGPNRIEPVEVPTPSIREGEALLQVDACGCCGSDLGIVAGIHPRAQAPLTIGHEFSGHIVDIASGNSEFKIGDAVTAYPLISCGRCFVCRTGNPHACWQLRLYGFDAEGGMAQFVKLPVGALISLPDGMDPILGALIEPLAVAVHGVGRAPGEAVRTVVVSGAGPIGLLTALVAQARGLGQVWIADVLPSRVALAKELGLRAVAAGDELAEMVAAETDAEGADVVFECSGAPSSARTMTSLVRCRGTIVNLGVFKKPVEVDLQAVNFKEITMIGSRVYSRQDFTDAIILAPGLPLKPIVTNVFSLSEVTAAFERFRAGDGVCKVIIRP